MLSKLKQGNYKGSHFISCFNQTCSMGSKGKKKSIYIFMSTVLPVPLQTE